MAVIAPFTTAPTPLFHPSMHLPHSYTATPFPSPPPLPQSDELWLTTPPQKNLFFFLSFSLCGIGRHTCQLGDGYSCLCLSSLMCFPFSLSMFVMGEYMPLLTGTIMVLCLHILNIKFNGTWCFLSKK